MKIILDTNVLISGVFFSGPPFQILDAWRNGKIKILISPEILAEYRKVGEILSEQFPSINLDSFFAIVAREAEIIAAPPLPEPVCEDPDDDKFLSCALSGQCRIIVSGDKHLKRISGYRGIVVITPRKFVEEYIR